MEGLWSMWQAWNKFMSVDPSVKSEHAEKKGKGEILWNDIFFLELSSSM